MITTLKDNLHASANSVTISSMKRSQRLDQSGVLNPLVLSVVGLAILFVVSLSFAVWAYGERQDYKNRSDAKVAAAVKVAKEEEGITKDKQHAEVDKQPLKMYTGPDAFGSVKVSYPKTWSGYVNDTGRGGTPLDGYFQPGVVPSTSNEASRFALRVEVTNQAYSSVIASFKSLVDAKKVTAIAYAFPSVPSVVGVRYDGAYDAAQKTTGTMIVVPLRDKTLKVSSESPTYAADFAAYVLPNLSFAP